MIGSQLKPSIFCGSGKVILKILIQYVVSKNLVFSINL